MKHRFAERPMPKWNVGAGAKRNRKIFGNFPQSVRKKKGAGFARFASGGFTGAGHETMISTSSRLCIPSIR